MAGAPAVILEDEAHSLGKADRVLERIWVPDDGEADLIQLCT